MGGGEGAPFRFPDARAGRRARAHAHWPVLAHLGLTHSVRQLGTRLPPQARPSARREAQSVWRAPEALSPAGRMSPAYVRTAPSKTTSTLACTPSRKVTRMGKAVSKRPSYPRRGRAGRVRGRRGQRGSGKPGKKTNRPASLPLLSLYCLSQEIKLSTASPHQACFCLFV